MMKISYKWLALSATGLGAFLSVMTGTALLIALPNIARGLHAPMITIIWVLISYMLATCVLVPSIGRIADMYGRKRLFILGGVVFTAASLFAGMSQTGIELLLVRVVQSVGGALMMANSTAIVTDAFPRGELGMALGINGMVIAVASAFGPIIGGVLVVTVGWRWIFFINVPLGAIVTVWAFIQVRDIAKLPKGERFDWLGAIFFTSGMFFLLYAMTEGAIGTWTSPIVIALFALAVVILPLFFVIESRVHQPMLDLGLFRTRVQVFAYCSSLMNGIARGALTFLLIFFLLGLKGMDAFTASLYLIPFAITMMIMAPISGRLSDRHGSRGLSSLGLLICAGGFIGFAVFTRVDMTLIEVIVWGAIVGVGSGMFNSPNINTIMGMVTPERRGIAASTQNMMAQAGSVISVAMAFAILSSGLTPLAMEQLFIGVQINGEGVLVNVFISDLRLAFLVSCVISIVAALISYMRGKMPALKHAEPQVREEIVMQQEESQLEEEGSNDSLESMNPSLER
jgi:EmrB/QacA subfamily drug resistance transporter